MGLWARTLGSSVAMAVALALFAASPAFANDAVAYQVDIAHSGVQTDEALAPPYTKAWQLSLPSNISYPVIAEGKVFVTAARTPGTYSTDLYAIDQADGQIAWSQPLDGVNYWSAAAYDAGSVFAITDRGILSAFDPATGAVKWSFHLPNQWSFNSAPTASNGVVYVSGAGSSGTLWAVDETTGAILGTQQVWNGEESSPALSDTSVFVSYACNQTYAFTRRTLDLIWHHTSSCEGGGGRTPVYAAGRLFARDWALGNLVIDAQSGADLRSFQADPAPAVDGATGWFLNGSALEARDSAKGTLKWSFTGDGQLTTAPIAIKNLSGEFLLEGSSSGMLYALDATSGSTVWSTNVGSSIPAPNERDTRQPLTGLSAGGGLLVVPAGRELVAYSGSPSHCDVGTGTIDGKFNNTPINAGRTIWFSSVFKATGLGSEPATVKLQDAKVVFSANGTTFTVPVPDATIAFSPATGAATTTYGPDGWQTSIRTGLGGNYFLSGVGYAVPADLPGSIQPISFTGTFLSSVPGVKISWKWGAAVYSNFNGDPNQLGVKPVDDGKASIYQNGDHAGTPEAYKKSVVAGATGGGGANATGNYSGTLTTPTCLG